MLADPQAELAKALGVDFDASPVLGSVRSKRCALSVSADNQAAFGKGGKQRLMIRQTIGG